MLNLRRKIAEQKAKSDVAAAGLPVAAAGGRISVRDKLLVGEVQDMMHHIPHTCQVQFDDPDRLHSFCLVITPDDGYWLGGTFRFHIEVPNEYNIVPPLARCLTRIWHPNITEDGNICLSLLRQNSHDALGWAPTRKLRDVVWGLNSLFTDLLNFDDPLNIEAAELYERDKKAFVEKVRYYIQSFASVSSTAMTNSADVGASNSLSRLWI